MFNMKCRVTSDATHKVMISKEVKVASYEEICGGEKRRVYFGYSNLWGLTVLDNKLQQAIHHDDGKENDGKRDKGDASMISRDWEILNMFISNHNVEPIWLDCRKNWGRYDKELKGWTGCMGKVI